MKIISYCIILLFCCFSFLLSGTHSFGGSSLSSLSVTSGSSPIVCRITASKGHVQCWKDGLVSDIFGNVSFQGIAGGIGVLCGVRYGGSSLICWNSTFSPKRIYQNKKNKTGSIKQLSVGRTQVCSITGNNDLWCWRDTRFHIHENRFKYVSSGDEYSCGIRLSDNAVSCFGKNKAAAIEMEDKLLNFKFTSLYVGGKHVCGLDLVGTAICEGNNHWGQTNVPDKTAHAFSSLALGINHTCGIWSANKSVTCWGSDGGYVKNQSINISVLSFETVVAGSDFTCGLLSTDTSVICWGIGWVYPNSPSFRSNTKHSTPHIKLHGRVLVVARVLLALGFVGILIGVSALIHCLLTRGDNTRVEKVEKDEELQLPISSRQLVTKITEVTLADIYLATDELSTKNQIGSGGSVYRGTLNGRDVAIKRIRRVDNSQVSQQSKMALGFRHKNLVRFVGYCIDKKDYYLVYDYMKDGSLFDELEKVDSNILNGWRTRISIALGAAKGIQYLHHFQDPTRAHGHVRSSNILLDENSEAYISDYGLEYDPFTNEDGYTDPRDSNDITSDITSDLYAFGVVLLELMFGGASISRVEDMIRTLDENRWAEYLDGTAEPYYDCFEGLKQLAQAAKLCLHSTPDTSMDDIVVCLADGLHTIDMAMNEGANMYLPDISPR